MEKSKIAVVKKTVKYTEMTVYSDLVVKNKAKTKLRAIGVKDSDCLLYTSDAADE